MAKHPSVTPDELAQTALASIGHCYAWGGAVGKQGIACTDCSGMCNNWYGRIWKLAIPGFPAGTYDGTEHGPSTVGWLDSVGQIVDVVDRSKAQAGDIACWQTHMGMCIDNVEFVSAANPSAGTIKAPIDGFIPGESLFILRLKSVAPGGSPIPIVITKDVHQVDVYIRKIAKSSQDAVWKKMQAQRALTRKF